MRKTEFLQKQFNESQLIREISITQHPCTKCTRILKRGCIPVPTTTAHRNAHLTNRVINCLGLIKQIPRDEVLNRLLNPNAKYLKILKSNVRHVIFLFLNEKVFKILLNDKQNVLRSNDYLHVNILISLFRFI